PADVKDIIRASQRNNAQVGVTGALLLVDGVFLQCLEGSVASVNALYHRIALDRRHQPHAPPAKKAAVDF
ncbi:BLUF domain-containing protein, partial [Escherichia coli]|uniref:BLUF domain-containing protein n=1 Tax=Escherichia coli TaxID=562 RepID=UPI0019345927